jgi:hypothetical protein
VREAAFAAHQPHIDIGIFADVFGRAARADLEIGRSLTSLVDQMMAVGHVFGEGGAIAGHEFRFAFVARQRQLARNHEDEFILRRVPMALAGPAAGRQPCEVDSEIAKPTDIAQALLDARTHRLVERRRIARAYSLGHGLHIDLRHWSTPSAKKNPPLR